MPRDGAGNYTVPYPDFVPGTVIDQSQVDANFADIASAIAQSIARNGEAVPSQNLPMGGKAHTGVADATAADQYAAVRQVQRSGITWCGTSTGTGSAYAVTLSPAFTGAYTAGMRVQFRVHADSLASPTLNVSSIGAKGIQWFRRGVLSDLPAGALVVGSVVDVSYQAAPLDKWVLLTPEAFRPEWQEISEAFSATTVTDVRFVLPSQFVRYKLTFQDFRPTASAVPFLRVSTDGGISYLQSAGNYSNIVGYDRQTGTTPTTYNPFLTQAFLQLGPTVDPNSSMCGFYEFQRNNGAFGFGMGVGANSSEGECAFRTSARVVTASDVTNIIVGYASTTVATHRIRLMGALA
jgi:hypothetical protein